MSRLSRRRFLGQAGALVCIAGLPSACTRAPTRKAVLAAIAQDIAIPDVAEVRARSLELQSSMAKFVAEPAANLLAVRKQWERALLTWKRAYSFRNGPIVESSALLRAMFWPVRATAIEAVVGEARAIDAARIEELGVDVKGLYALEHLLFAGEDDEAVIARFSGEEGARTRQLAVAIAQEVYSHASQAAKLLGDGQGFAARFAETGQEGVARLVEQMVVTIETVSAGQLDRVRELSAVRALKQSEVEGGLSGVSHKVPLALLAGTERLYMGTTGQGLGALVAHASGAIDEHLRASFASALAAVGALSAPLEQIVKQQPEALEAACRATKELELALKVELTSALGVNLTFTSGDGD